MNIFKNQNITIIAVTFFATVLTLFMSGKISDFAIKEVLLVLTSFISVAAICLGYLSYFRTEKNQANITDNIQKLDKLRKTLSNIEKEDSLSWLLNESKLLLHEKSKQNCREIWIISPDPNDDTGESRWVAVIRDNISNGINYCYIAPAIDSLDGAINGLKSVFRNKLEHCKIVKLEMDEYKALPHEHLVIYDPQNNHDEYDSFAELDIEEKGWWIKLPDIKRNLIVGKLTPYIKKSIPLDKI